MVVTNPGGETDIFYNGFTVRTQDNDSDGIYDDREAEFGPGGIIIQNPSSSPPNTASLINTALDGSTIITGDLTVDLPAETTTTEGITINFNIDEVSPSVGPSATISGATLPVSSTKSITMPFIDSQGQPMSAVCIDDTLNATVDAMIGSGCGGQRVFMYIPALDGALNRSGPYIVYRSGAFITVEGLSHTAIATLLTVPARFNWYHGTGCYEVNFDATDNNGSTYKWDFGDGNTGTGQIISHSYDVDGSYAVTLTVDGTHHRTMVVPVRSSNILPSVSMNVTVDSSDSTGMTLQVQDTSTDNSCEGSNTGTAVIVWGDGTTTLQEISTCDIVGSHEYRQKGTYTISYSFENSEGNRAMASPVTVKVPDIVTSVCNVEGDIIGTTPLINTTVKLKQGYSVVKMGSTDAAGHYSFPNVQAGKTYTIEPSRNGYSFTETGTDSSDFVLNCSSNATGHDFTAVSVW